MRQQYCIECAKYGVKVKVESRRGKVTAATTECSWHMWLKGHYIIFDKDKFSTEVSWEEYRRAVGKAGYHITFPPKRIRVLEMI